MKKQFLIALIVILWGFNCIQSDEKDVIKEYNINSGTIFQEIDSMITNPELIIEKLNNQKFKDFVPGLEHRESYLKRVIKKVNNFKIYQFDNVHLESHFKNDSIFSYTLYVKINDKADDNITFFYKISIDNPVWILFYIEIGEMNFID